MAQEGGQLRDTSRNVERRALDAIARAEAITRRHYRSGGRSPSMSRSPSPSPNYRRGMPPASKSQDDHDVTPHFVVMWSSLCINVGCNIQWLQLSVMFDV